MDVSRSSGRDFKGLMKGSSVSLDTRAPARSIASEAWTIQIEIEIEMDHRSLCLAFLGCFPGGVAQLGLAYRGLALLAYAEKHRSDYRATWWIRAQTASSMRADLVALGVRLGWVSADEKEDDMLADVMERLRDKGDRLLLIDNAIDGD
jgi:hypothetical protein